MSIVDMKIQGMSLLDQYGLMVKTKDLALPLPKTNYVDVEGANGSLDLSTSLTNGAIRFHDRDISLILTGTEDVISKRDLISTYIHGKVHEFSFSDDPNYYYKGRLWVNQWTYLSSISEFEIVGKVSPFRTPFAERSEVVFVNGTSSRSVYNDSDSDWSIFLNVQIDAGSTMTLVLGTKRITLVEGENDVNIFALPHSQFPMKFEGKGRIEIKYLPRRI